MEEEIRKARIIKDHMKMNNLIDRFGEILREQQDKIHDLERKLLEASSSSDEMKQKIKA